jgi:cell wall-associated NlpC family hydrolase
VTLVGEELLIDGLTVDPNVSNSIINATHTRTMDGAASIDLTVHDPNMQLLLSGALTKPGRPSARQKRFEEAAWDRFGSARMALDGFFFRLAGVDPSYDASEQSITITFEDECASILRAQSKAIKWKRGERIEPGKKHGLRPATRADFIENMWLEARFHDPLGTRTGRFFSPQQSAVEPVAKVKVEPRKKGLSDKTLTIADAAITRAQRHELVIALTEADAQRAGELATLAMLVAGCGESTWRPIPNSGGSPYTGVFQGSKSIFKATDTQAEAHYFLRGGKGYQAGGAIDYASKNPDATPGTIAFNVEGDRSNFTSDAQAAGFYDKFGDEAKAILSAWGGAGKQTVIRERFEFKAGGRSSGQKTTWWDSAGDLADEVRWRRFADANILYFVPDDWLFSRKPTFVIDVKDGLHSLVQQGVTSFRPTMDIGKPVGEILLNVEAPRWTVPPGCVFELTHCGPLTGRWLAWEVQHDLTARVERAQVTLRRPAPKKKEPAPAARTGILTESTPDKGSVRDRIVSAARKAHGLISHYRYGQVRPMPSSLYAFPHIALPTGGTSKGVLVIDCSAFATLCYKAAGAPNPNAGSYDGSGYTGTLINNGKKTSDPQPGDLVFYAPGGGAGGAPGHVGVYIGGGKVIEMGGTPGPLELKVKYRSDFMGYWTYDLGEGN